MLDEVETNASNDRDLVNGHRPKKLLYCDFLICDFGGRIKDITIRYINDFGLQACGFSGCAYIKV